MPEESLGNLRLSSWPNPFNPRTTISCWMAEPGHVTLRLCDLAGRTITILFNDWHGAGELHADWDGRDEAGRSVAAGVYLAVLQSGDRSSSLKVVLLE